MFEQNRKLRLLACLIFIVFGVLIFSQPSYARNTPVGEVGFWKSAFDIRIGGDLVYSENFEYQVRETVLPSDPGVRKKLYTLVASDRRKYEIWSIDLSVESAPVGGGLVTHHGKYCDDVFFKKGYPLVAHCRFPHNEDMTGKNETLKVLNPATGALEKSIDLPTGEKYLPSTHGWGIPKVIDGLLLISQNDYHHQQPKTAAIDVQAGNVRWTVELNQNGEKTIIDNDIIYRRREPHPTLPPIWESPAERIVRFDLTTGQWLWESEAFDSVGGMAFKSNEDFFYATATALDGKSSFILAMQPSDGTELFRIESNLILSLPSEFEGDLFFGGNKVLTGHNPDDHGYMRGPHTVHRYDLETKQLLWKVQFNDIPLYYNNAGLEVKGGVGIANYYESEMDCDKTVRFDLTNGNVLDIATECDSDD